MNKVELDNELQQELDDLMQKGYTLSMSGDSEGAAFVWIQLWKKAIETMDSYKLESVEELDKSFHGLQCFFNWASDFDLELENLGRKNSVFLQHRIDFCSEYVARSEDESEGNILNMKRAIAESYFELGRADEGENLFKEYLEEFPTWGWGWIGWSDQYWLFAKENNKNSEKAIKILKQALEVEGLEDRYDVLDRLSDIYTELGKLEEAGSVRQQIIDYVREKNAQRPIVSLPPIQKAVPVKSTKIGRNDPCTCGSGKKYKKCCGK
jgi:tetratricopeptide (TPR) repeat protein